MTTLSTLYKQKNNKIMQWWITINFKDPSYTVHHGYVNGAIQSSTTSVFEGKNIGKANATTPRKQCELEAIALWTKQRDRKGYSEQVQDKPIMPMLAHKWDDHGHKLTFPLYLQVKLDGTRALAHIKGGKVKFVSRQNKEYLGLDHISKSLQHLPDMILDGEFFNKDIGFRNIISGLKKEGGNQYTPLIEYHVYDVVTNKPYSERLALIQSLNLKQPIISVQTTTVKSLKEIKEYHDQFVKDGYEGVMLRDPNGIYECDKRSKSLLKFKKFSDKEYIIIGAGENKGKLENTCTFICKTKTNKEFGAIPEGTFAERQKYWTDWQSGKIKHGDSATIRYFEFTDDVNEIPRFPIFVEVRNYE
jgi:DNA ligase-1